MDSENEEPTLNEIQRDENGGSKRPSGLIIGGVVIVAILIIIGLFLPPISLGERLGLGGGDETATDSQDAAVENTGDGATSIPGEITLTVADGAGTVTVNATSLDEFIQANTNAAMPEGTAVQGNVYTITYEGDAPNGQAELTIPEATAPETIDLVGWNGSAWDFIPSQVNSAEQQIETTGNTPIPHAYALVVLPASQNPEIGTEVQPGEELALELLPLLTKVNVAGLSLADGGALEGETQPLPTGPYDQYVSASNVSAIIDQEALSTMLNDANVQAAQLGALVSAAANGDYAGVNLDYQEVSKSDSAAFTQFVASLAETLDQQGMKLALTLATPDQIGDSWDSAGQDWTALGEIANVVFLQMPGDPAAYAEDGAADQLLAWAVRQIPRDKLMMLLTANAISRVGEFSQEIPNVEAMANFGVMEFVQGSEKVEPGTAVEVALSGTAGPLEWDGEGLTYKYSYTDDNDQIHEVWLGNATALANHLRLARKYNLDGVSVRGLGSVVDGAGYAAAINSYLTNGEIPAPQSAAIVWTVRDGADSIVASATGEALTFTWDGSEDVGDYTIGAEFALGETIIPIGASTIAVGEKEEVVVEEPEEEAPAATLEGADATVNAAANIRYGPGVTYGIIANGLQAGTKVKVIGRDEASTWLNIITPDGEEAWIFGTLLTLDPGVNVASLPIGKARQSPSLAAGDDTSSSGAPPPVAAGPVTNAGFELGGQTHSFANPQLMSTAGMNWVKFQHKWGPGGNPGDLAGRINNAHASGFKVLLSIPGTPYPSSIGFEEYAKFVGGVAALGPDAIEIWNEENIDFEWPAGQIDPAAYVNKMLAPAYNAIKTANPNVMVIGGALAPTGYFGGGCSANGCDDNAYLAGMAAAGGANYMDCMGVHYNAGATSPSATSGHPAGGTHYSWYLQPMLNTYSVLGKPLCITELGYLSGQDYGGVPDRFSWAGSTTVNQHATWLAEAVSMAANSGQVRLAIVFNVDFTQWGSDPQAGYAMIRKDGSCPACGTLGSVMGR